MGNVTPIFSVIEVQCSSGITLQVEATNSSETLVTTYQTTRRHMPEDGNLHQHEDDMPLAAATL
jgi:hypothetical protein